MIDIEKLNPNNVEDLLTELRDKFIFQEAINDWANQYALCHIDHYKDIIRNLRSIYSLKKFERLLDVGGVPGHIAAIVRQIGFDIDVVDIKPERAKGLFHSMDIAYYRVDVESEHLPFSDNTYDLVLFSEVLEHLRNNPLSALVEIRRVLKPGGICLLSTPQITPLMRWRFLLGYDYQDDIIGEYAKLDTIGHMGHIRLYSKTEVERVLKYLNFNIVQMDSGGKLSGKDEGIVASLLRIFIPDKMRVQIYVWAEKSA